MNDPDILDLFLSRSEDALTEVKRRFGGLMLSVARGILRDSRDAEETVSDALLAAWNSIPPNKPENMPAYMAKLTRNAAVDRYRKNSRLKRGGGEYEAVLDEAECLSDGRDLTDRIALMDSLNGFLKALPKKKRTIFVQRYWYLMPIKEIAREQLMSEAAVKTELSRLREALRKKFEREGFYCE